MKILMTGLLVVLLAWPSGPGHAAAPVALIDVSQTAGPDWLEQDRKAIKDFHQALSRLPDVQLLSLEAINAYFREPPEAAAQPLVARAREDLARGREFSQLLKPDQAITRLQDALRILRAVFPYLNGLGDLEEAHLLLGMTYQALGKIREAAGQYRMVLLLNPERALDEAQVNPVVIDRFSRVRQELLTSVKGSLSLVATPPGGQVFMDGRPVGYAPVTIAGVYPGEHYFSLQTDGYKTWFGILKVPPGGLETREVFPVEGESIPRVRLRNRLAEAGVSAARAEDARELAEGLDADWLVLVAVTHAGGRPLLEVGMFQRREQTVSALGVFPAEGAALSGIAERVGKWLNGDRTIARAVVQPPPGNPRPDLVPAPPNPPVPPPPPDRGPFYTQWWFWTAVGAVVAGVTVTTAVVLTRESGLKIEVYR